MERLMQIKCDPVCGFMVRSHNEQEILRMGKQHVTEKHKMKMTDKELRSQMEAV